MSTSAFPPEIYDKIIDNVADYSKQNLSACSLVERSWAPRSRTHMFRNVEFRVPSSNTNAYADRPIATEHTASFQKYVASNAKIAAYARSLVLTLNSHDDIAPAIPNTSLLVNLQSLTLKCSNVIIPSVNDPKLTRVLSFIRHNAKLEHLSLHSIVIDPAALDVFFACIAIRAQHLQSLHLHNVWSPDWKNDAWGNSRRTTASAHFPANRKSASLTRLCIRSCETGVIPAFLRTADVRNLEKLCLIDQEGEGCVMLLAASTTEFCPSLHHLTLDFSEARSMTSPLYAKSTFDCLARMTTAQLLLKHVKDAPSVLQMLLVSASWGNSTLRNLHLQFKYCPYPNDSLIDSAMVELCSCIPSLRITIGFNYISREGPRDPHVRGTLRTPKEIWTLFPRMNATGRLCFGSWEEWWAS